MRDFLAQRANLERVEVAHAGPHVGEARESLVRDALEQRLHVLLATFEAHAVTPSDAKSAAETRARGVRMELLLEASLSGYWKHIPAGH